MTTVTIQHQWADGSLTSVEVDVENDYPDCLATARATAVRALAEAVEALTAEGE